MVPDFIAVLDHQFNIIATNQSFKNAFGDQTGIGFFDIFSSRVLQTRSRPLKKHLPTARPIRWKPS
ncbi:MAG: hypothetical protein R2874_07720 [Desulfobacterales bacterium]